MTEFQRKLANPVVVKAVAAAAILITVLPLLLLIWFAFILWSDFSDKVMVQTTSPNGKRTAVFIARDGGATESFNRFVVLCEGRNGCTADGKNVVAWEKSTGISTIRWAGNEKLLIYYSAQHTHFDDKQATKNGVKIVYVPTEK